MPGLSQLKKFNADILSLGNEPGLRASRGEKPVTVPIPKDIEDVDDSDDFITGMPEPVEYDVKPEKAANVEEDFSDIMGTSSAPAATNAAQPESAISVPDLSSLTDLGAFADSGDEDSDMMGPDLSMFADPIEESEPEPEPEPEEPEISDLSLEDLLGGMGFDGSEGTEEKQEEPETENYDIPADVSNAEEVNVDDIISQTQQAADATESDEEVDEFETLLAQSKMAHDSLQNDISDVSEAYDNNSLDDLEDFNSDQFEQPEEVVDLENASESAEYVEPVESMDSLESMDLPDDFLSMPDGIDESTAQDDFGAANISDLPADDFGASDFDFSEPVDLGADNDSENGLNSDFEDISFDDLENADDNEAEAVKKSPEAVETDKEFEFSGDAIDMADGLPEDMVEVAKPIVPVGNAKNDDGFDEISLDDIEEQPGNISTDSGTENTEKFKYPSFEGFNLDDIDLGDGKVDLSENDDEESEAVDLSSEENPFGEGISIEDVDFSDDKSSAAEINNDFDISSMDFSLDDLPEMNDDGSSGDDSFGMESMDLGTVTDESPVAGAEDSFNLDSMDLGSGDDSFGMESMDLGTVTDESPAAGAEDSFNLDSMDLGSGDDSFGMESMDFGTGTDESPAADAEDSFNLDSMDLGSGDDSFGMESIDFGTGTDESPATGVEDSFNLDSMDLGSGDDSFGMESMDLGTGAGDSLDFGSDDSFGMDEMSSASEESSGSSGESTGLGDDFPDFNISDFDDTAAASSDSDFSDSETIETFDTSEMDGLEFPETDSKLNGESGFELGSSDEFGMDNGDFEIPGFSDVDTVEVNKNGKIKVPEAEKQEPEIDENSDLPPNTLSDEQYKKFLKNLSTYPLNVRVAVEELIVKNEFTDEAEFEIVKKVLKKVSARQLASELEKMLDVSISVPRDFERRTAEEYEAYKQSFQYQLKNKIIPGAVVSIAAVIICFFLFEFSKNFIYKPARASILYKQGYTLLENEDFPQSETKFNEATKYNLQRKWFFKYAHGYQDHKQYIRAEQMYRNILYCFKNDKQGGLEYAAMELNDLANYEKAEQILLRNVLDYYVNDQDGILLLGDNYLEWATEKDPAKFDDARKCYSDLMQLYGNNPVKYDLFSSRMMRYFIRTDNLLEVLTLKEHFYPRKKSLSAVDWTDLSGYLLDKLYGNLSPTDEYLRSKIEDVKDMLVTAVKSDSSNPVAHYNMAKYYINTNNSVYAKLSLNNSLVAFEQAASMKRKDIYKYIDAHRLLGEEYVKETDYLKAMESFTNGISLFTAENIGSGLSGNRNIGKLYSDYGDIEYFISGNMDSALDNYQDAIENEYDTGENRYKIGFIQYGRKNYSEAIGSFMKAGEDFSDDPNLLLAMGNTLSLRGDNYAAQSYYQRLLDQLNAEKEQKGVLFPQVRKDEAEIVDNYMKVTNNLGVTLYRLARRTGSSAMNAQAMVNFQNSLRAWDSMTRNQQTMIRLSGSNLAEQNIKYVIRPVSEFEPAIYTDISGTLSCEEGFVK